MALKAVIGALRVNLGLDSAEFRNGLKSADDRSKRFARTVTVGLAGAVTAATGALGLMTKQAMGAVDAQAKLAQSLGTTVKSVQVLSRAGDLSGVAMGTVEQATKDLTRRLSQAATGTGPAVDALKRLNLTAGDLLAMPLDARVEAINAAILDFVPAAQQAAVAGQLFGEEGSIAMSRMDPATLRQAARDVEDFGVVVSELDADNIESANDAVSRLGLVATGLGNSLAAAAAPGIERLANGFADLWRKGAPLASALDLVLTNLDRVAAYAGTAATLIAGRFAASFAAATVAAAALNAKLLLTRAALMRTGIGALVVGAGELVLWFGRLVTAAGGFGAALDLMKDVAAEVWDRIVMGPELMRLRMEELGARMKAIWGDVMVYLQEKWSGFLARFADLPDILPGAAALKEAADGAAEGLAAAKEAAAAAGDEAKRLKREANGVADAMIRTPLASMAALKETLAGVSDEAGNTATSLARIGEAANDGAGIDKLKTTTKDLADTAKATGDSFKTFFKDLAKGSGDAGDAISALADRMLDDLLDRALSPVSTAMGGFFDSLFAGMFGGAGAGGGVTVNALGNVFEGGRIRAFAAGGVVDRPTFFPMKGATTGLMGEAGPEAILPLTRLGNGKLGVASLGGGGSVRMGDVHVSVAGSTASPEEIAEVVRRVTRDEAQRVYARQRREGV
ncbi:phage tail tape measure protein [Rhodovulum kholense]|uniref:Lambda family phage tail tape measure protein n=1 Tax=Rhodovulum kholense TaxID=453584 RepID=A0A8E2VHB1_9RHOB|nr:phage tail tape measure protein [Rhodovulum kholense]PTW45289.1 lambda family phage tail tape measure protein [Rhodovulum kholense]